MKLAALPIIILPFILTYLVGVMVALDWNLCNWSLWVQIFIFGIYFLQIVFWILIWLLSRHRFD